MSLKDYIAKLPLKTIENLYISNVRIVFPTEIDPNKFYEELETDIKQSELTTEKALFATSMTKTTNYKSSFDLLVSKLKF